MPTSGSVVLDTNIAIAFLSDDRSVRQHVRGKKGVRNRFLIRASGLRSFWGLGRPHRAAEGGYVYYVLSRANARIIIFAGACDYEAFEQVLAEPVERTGDGTT